MEKRIMVKCKCTLQKIITIQHGYKYKQDALYRALHVSLFLHNIYNFFSYVFLSIEKIKFKGYIINNVSDDIIGATKRETCSKS
jgi:hypothetical protein